ACIAGSRKANTRKTRFILRTLVSIGRFMSELEDRAEYAGRDDRDWIDDHLWLFGAAGKLVGNSDQAAISPIAEQCAEDGKFAKQPVNAIGWHECAGDRHVSLLVIECSLKGRTDGRTTHHTLGQVQIAIALLNQRKAAFDINARNVNIALHSLIETGSAIRW